MAYAEKKIEVNVPVRTAYNQWTQFEEFPRFMEGVKEVKQLDNKRLFWHAEIGGRDEKWEAEITEQEPDRVIAWRSTSGTPNGGRVTFQPLGADRTEVTVRMEYEPEGLVEKAGDALGVVERRVEGDLKRYKEYIESRGSETGAWRGKIQGGHVEHTSQ
ncbi:MAG TPA: SRPBCC family protein [Chloroflexia bacterium]|nr:SRPBCC family protein [Chloroflexia bacterium]